ncbi:MAG: ABC transporter substrate-binding protein [Spirochaetales bacterium]|nr:ABC transporter substrate-binding protein [Spirochaetales bacterium]
MKKSMLLLCVMMLIGSFSAFAGGQEEGGDGYTIGISNAWVGSEWRTQMVDDVKAAAKPYIDQGLIKKIIVQSFDVSTEGQIDQIRNLISSGADLILINPADATALTPVIAEAKSQGVIVIGTDTELSSPDAVNVAINQKEWAAISARWLVEKLGKKGNVVCINGYAGHPANTARVAGYTEVFNSYPDIKILNEVNADWDNAKGQAAMADMLATYPNINGVWVQDGMAAGAFRAIQAAGRDDIFSTGEARVDFLKMWKTEGLDMIGVANPPGAMTSAFFVGMQMLAGKEFKDGIFEGPYGNTIYVPVPTVVTNINFDTVYNAYKDYPDYFAVDGHLTEAQASAYFK